MPTPRLWTGSVVTSRSPNQIRPASGTTNPASMRRSVVLPHPDGPRRVNNTPAGISRSSPSKRATPSYRWVTPSKRMRVPVWVTTLRREREFDRRTHGGRLRRDALLGVRARAVRIDLGGGPEGGFGASRAEPDLLHRIEDHTRRHHRRSDDPPFCIRFRDVRDASDRRDDGLLELELRPPGVTAQVEPVRNLARLERLAVAR